MDVATAVARGLSLSASNSIPVGETWPIIPSNSGGGGGGGGCTGRPKLGNLCGLDAIGAIIGIALGGAALLALLVAALAYALRGKVR